MDREFLEENISAYLDGELSTEDQAKFEIELSKHLDLEELVEKMRSLDKLARSAEVEMPDDNYFDQLAERIEAKLPEREPVEDEVESRQRARMVDSYLANRKAVKIISSVAAVILVALIGVQIYGPATPEYPREIRRYEVEPAIDRQKLEKSETSPPSIQMEEQEGETQIQPVPEVEGEVGEPDVAAKKDEVVREEAKVTEQTTEAATPKITDITISPESEPAKMRESLIPQKVKPGAVRDEAMSLKSGPGLVTTQQTLLPSNRPPVASLREFAYADLGYLSVPEPEAFAEGVLDSLAAKPKARLNAFSLDDVKKTTVAEKRQYTTTGDSEADAASAADPGRLTNRAELAYQLAVSDSSNVYDIILARLLADKALKAGADKGVWTNRLMQLVRLEQFERRRWQESQGQD